MSERRRELAQRGTHVAWRAVDVVEHQQRRTPRIARARDGHERRLGRSRPGRVEHRRLLAVGVARDRCRQPGLAHAIRADERDKRASARRGPLPTRAHPAQLALAADHRRRGRSGELARQLGCGGLDVQRRVLAQDRLVQAPKLGARLDPDLLDQRAPGVPIGLQRLRLAPAPIQREHPLRVQPFA